MALSFDRIKTISDKSKLVVYGFIHQTENILSHAENKTIIPDLVINLCILFYALLDRFDPKCIGPDMKLNEETQCIVQMKTGSNSAFLSNIFESGSYYWRFKINECESGRDKDPWWSQSIGIWQVKSDDTNEVECAMLTYFTEYSNRTYGFANDYGELIDRRTGCVEDEKYGIQTKTGDIVEMYADMDNLELRFIINDIDYGKAFDIEAGKYRAVINLYDAEDSITLLE